jgi:hypothetical protein
MTASKFLVGGYVVRVQDAYYQTLPSGMNKVILASPPVSGTRDDLVYLEVWFQEVGYAGNVDQVDSTIYKNGGVNSGTSTNTLYDDRVAEETSRRVQLRWRITTAQGVNFASYPDGLNDPSVKARGGAAGTTAFTFSSADIGLYSAGSGSSSDSISLNSVYGIVYAIPLFKVTRRNTTAYNAGTNSNGGNIWVDSSSVPTRPDGKFSNAIYSTDIADLRKNISVLTASSLVDANTVRGYVPADKAGDVFSGNVTLANNIAVIGTKADASTFTALRPNAANGLDVGSTAVPLNLELRRRAGGLSGRERG